MAGFIDKMRDYFLGSSMDEEDEYYETEEVDVEDNDDADSREVMDITSLRQRKSAEWNERRERHAAERANSERNGSKVVNFHPQHETQVVLATPKKVADVASLCDGIREGKTVIVNLEGVEKPEAQRIADFLSGAAYSLQGDIQRISKAIFIVAPSGVKVSGEHLKEELKASGLILPWVTSL
jgi:cell division inhibitor SepF